MQDFQITTHDQISGYKTVYSHGIVIGNKVSRLSALSSWFGKMFSGEKMTYSEVVQEAREEAIDRMMHEALILGANAITGFGMHTSKLIGRFYEVAVFGTAVEIKPTIES